MNTISFIIGGLGNQLFQYAMGRAVAHRNNTPLILDMRGYVELNGGCTRRSFLLDKFNISAIPAHPQLVRKIISTGRIPVVHEPHYNFWSDGLALGACYLDGYWQSEKYFMDIRDILLQEFTLKESSALYSTWSNRILVSDMACIHVRHGDFLNPGLAAKHGVLDIDYYMRGVGRVLDGHDVEFYVYSDDPEWCIASLIPALEVRYGNRFHIAPGLVDYEYMMLMSNHRHFVIANSSFSWWSAWLCRDTGVVVCPTQWMADKSVNTVDICPERWVHL